MSAPTGALPARRRSGAALSLAGPRAFPLALRIAAAAVALVAVAYLGISLKYAEGVTKVERKPLARIPAYVAPVHQDVSFRSSDGLLLRGWWFASPSPRARAAVLVHGKDQNRIVGALDRIARALLVNGYGVLMFDLRGHGESEGLRWGLGQHEPKDILAAVEFAAARAGVGRERVALIGESMGGGSVLMTVGADARIGPVVTDSAYADARVVVDEVGPQYSGLPAAFTPGLVFMAWLFFDLDIARIVPVDVVRAHPERAFLFIQCENDRTVARHHGEDLRRASANPRTQLWLAPDCGHVRSFIAHPAEWEQRVLAFLEAELGR